MSGVVILLTIWTIAYPSGVQSTLPLVFHDCRAAIATVQAGLERQHLLPPRHALTCVPAPAILDPDEGE